MGTLTTSLKKYDSQIVVADVSVHLQNSKKDIEKKYKPLFQGLAKDFKNSEFKGQVGVFVTNIFKGENASWKENPIVILNSAIYHLEKQVDWMIDFVDDIKTPKLLRDALDYRTATVFQMVNYHKQVLEFSRAIAITLIDEQIHLLNEEKDVPEHYRKLILGNPKMVQSLAKFCKSATSKDKSLEKTVYNLPEIMVTEESEVMVKSNFSGGAFYDTFGLDVIFSIPLKLGFFATKLISESKLRSLDYEREELDLLEMKRQEYALALNDQPNAKLEQVIERYDEAIEAKRYKIKKLMEKLG